MTNLDSILYKVTKPARYTGGEWNSIAKDWEPTPLRFALIYPDLYEIGMSNMALPILYDLLNRQPDAMAERAFAPAKDMETAMREAGIPLFSLESRRPLKEFDVIGFSLGYELTYTNVLNMLDLAQIPVLAAERKDSHPLIIAGGTCALNPEPMTDFIDAFVIGDGEEVVMELLDCLRAWKQEKQPKNQLPVAGKVELLRRLATIPGIYIPSLYSIEYLPDGRIKNITPTVPEASPTIRRRIIEKLPPPVTSPVVPFIEIVHDRAAIEIQRGCTHGCRFCQAGTIYRPVRVRAQEEVIRAVGEMVENTGYNEVSLVSLSSGDYPGIDELVSRLTQLYPDLALSLPSLYIDSFSIELMDRLPRQHKTGLTFAPEAGSENLRSGINKPISEQKLLETAALAFERGWPGLKLYFMVGLPGETMDDVAGIVTLIDEVRRLGVHLKGRTPQIRVTISTFIPKPHTAFEWAAQEDEATLNAKQDLLRDGLRKKGVKISWHDPKISQLEAVMSRGDRRLGKVIHRAWQLGCAFDSWSEHLDLGKWQQAFEETGIDPDFYARRQRDFDEVLPWSHIDTGVSAAFLKREFQRSLDAKVTRDCRTEACNACGLEKTMAQCVEKVGRIK